VTAASTTLTSVHKVLGVTFHSLTGMPGAKLMELDQGHSVCSF